MISDQFVIDALTEAGLWGNENIYFMADVVKPLWKSVVDSQNLYAKVLARSSYVFINKTEDGIGIIPLTVDAIKGITLFVKAKEFIPNNEIQAVKMKKSFGSIKLVIENIDGSSSSFSVGKKNGKIIQHEPNFKTFMNMYM